MRNCIAILLALCVLVVFTSCENNHKNTSLSSYLVTTTSSTVTTTTTVITDAPTTTIVTTRKQTSTTIPSSTTKNTATSTTTKTKCCQRYKEGSLVVLGGDWRERKPGIENRIALMADCTEKRPVVYKCPQCLEIALYEELEPKGHDFSGGEEILIRYPTVEQEGCYGIRCQGLRCGETKITKTLPKRTGDYSTIDSCFEVVITGLIPSGEWYEYKTEDLEFSIADKRTWGSVPTITYDAKSNSGTVSVLQKDGSFVTYSFTIDLEKIAQGMHYTGRIQENGVYSGYYWTLGSNGTAN